MSRTALLCAGLAALMLAGPVSAADTSTTTATTPSGYAEAKAAVDARQYAQALRLLVPVVKAEPKNADAWNLMGYSSRHLKNYTEAARYYALALRANPRHVGALEYQGELFVETGDYAKARQNLLMLQSICGGCEEAVDLQNALYEAGQG